MDEVTVYRSLKVSIVDPIKRGLKGDLEDALAAEGVIEFQLLTRLKGD